MSGLLTAPYPQYRPSGIEWIQELPEHWTNSSLGFECSVKARLGWRGLKAEEYVDSGYIFLATPNIKGNSIDFDDVNYITQERYEESPEIMLKVGDVLVTKDGSTTGTTNLVTHLPGPATVNSSIAVLRSFGKLDSRYLYQFFTSDYVQNVISRMRGGMGVPHLFQADLRKFFVSVPPLEEQTQIAKFLDYETAKIDALIEKQQQLIALLKEKLQAVISHAVTKGLNPDTPLRDSGVEWLGEVPAHWVVRRLKHVSPKVGVGLVINPSIYTRDEGVYFIFGGDVKEYRFDLTNTRRISPEDSNRLTPSRLNSGDLISVRVGDPGITAVVPAELEGSNCASVIIVRCGDFDSGWLCSAMNSWVGRQQVGRVAYGAAQKQFNVSDAVEFVFPVPPRQEQDAIAKFIADKLHRFDTLSRSASEAVELLQERRTALISAAVTGKIDVRGWKPPESKPETEAA